MAAWGRVSTSRQVAVAATAHLARRWRRVAAERRQRRDGWSRSSIISTSGAVTLNACVPGEPGAHGNESNTAIAGAGGIEIAGRCGIGGKVGNGGGGGFGGLFSVSTSGATVTVVRRQHQCQRRRHLCQLNCAGNGGVGHLRYGFSRRHVGKIAGDGGLGGSVGITSSNGYVIINNPISAVGGAGGDNSAVGGNGAMATDGTAVKGGQGGRGGSVGSGAGGGGDGGIGGAISISSGSTAGTLNPVIVPITIFAPLLASGGAGGALAATGGSGGTGVGMGTLSGGAGGNILNGGGGGGGGGSILITGKDSINIHAVDISGGAGGGLTGNGGNAGDGPNGGDGGSMGASGGGGGGGTLTVVTSVIPPNRPTTITVAFNDIVNAGAARQAFGGRHRPETAAMG